MLTGRREEVVKEAGEIVPMMEISYRGWRVVHWEEER